MLSYRHKATATLHKGGVADERNRYHRIVNARTYGYFSGHPDKEITAPDPSEKRQFHPILVDRLPVFDTGTALSGQGSANSP